MPEKPQCPTCESSERVVPIEYGEPGSDLSEAAERGECVIGGCLVGDVMARWCCKKCRKHFGEEPYPWAQ